MILRNGQPDDVSDKGFEPTTENIDTDKSSLYLTSTQKIPVTAVETTKLLANRQRPLKSIPLIRLY